MILPVFNPALSAAIPTALRQALIDSNNSTNGAYRTYKNNWLGATRIPSSLGNQSNQNYIRLTINKLHLIKGLCLCQRGASIFTDIVIVFGVFLSFLIFGTSVTQEKKATDLTTGIHCGLVGRTRADANRS